MNYTISVIDSEYLVIKPVRKMTDAEYDEVKPLIESTGGHWREKYKGFVFKTDTSHREAYSEDKEKNQFFPTPEKVAKRVVELCGLDKVNYNIVDSNSNYKIMEPSAGQGSLLIAIPDDVKYYAEEIVVEPNDTNIKALNILGYTVEEMTFEKFYDKCKFARELPYEEHHGIYGSITHVVMNPPFSGSRDIKHTMLAYNMLQEGGTLVSVVSENALYYENENSEKFREWIKEVDAYIEEVPYGSFRESGTLVDTVIIKVVKK